jgi:hypothetical protein
MRCAQSRSARPARRRLARRAACRRRVPRALSPCQTVRRPTRKERAISADRYASPGRPLWFWHPGLIKRLSIVTLGKLDEALTRCCTARGRAVSQAAVQRELGRGRTRSWPTSPTLTPSGERSFVGRIPIGARPVLDTESSQDTLRDREGWMRAGAVAPACASIDGHG